VTGYGRMQRVMGNGPGLAVRGVLHSRRGDCSGLLTGIPFLPLLDQPPSSPAQSKATSSSALHVSARKVSSASSSESLSGRRPQFEKAC
jgi:hypothetical protein